MNKPSRDQVRAAVVGAVLALVIIGGVTGIWASYVVWTRALHGQMAYEFIASQIQAQTPKAPVMDPAKPKTP